MSSSSEEELDELLRRQVMRQPGNFEERRLFDIENPREFREKFRLPVDAFVHLLELIGPRLEHRTRRNRPLMARQQLLVFLRFLGTNSFYHVIHSGHGISTSTVWHIIHRVVPVILSFKVYMTQFFFFFFLFGKSFEIQKNGISLFEISFFVLGILTFFYYAN